ATPPSSRPSTTSTPRPTSWTATPTSRPRLAHCYRRSGSNETIRCNRRAGLLHLRPRFSGSSYLRGLYGFWCNRPDTPMRVGGEGHHDRDTGGHGFVDEISRTKVQGSCFGGSGHD